MNNNAKSGRGIGRIAKAIVLVAVIPAGIGYYIAVPAANGLTLSDNDRAAQAAYRVQARAGNLQASYQDVSAVIHATGNKDAGIQVSIQHPAPTAVSAAPASNPSAGAPEETVPHEAWEQVVTDADGNVFATDAEPGSAGAELDRQAQEVNKGRPDTPTQVKIADLRGHWHPRYQKAQNAHDRLYSSVADMKAYAEAYFDNQEAKIAELDPGANNYAALRQRARNILSRQESAYRNWRANAERTLAESARILREMRNINRSLEFTSDAGEFDKAVSIPVSFVEMESLNADLGVFETETLALMDAMANPDLNP